MKASVSRILFPFIGDGDHSSGPCVTARLERPTRKRRRIASAPERATRFSFPYLALHREEFTWPASVTRRAGELLPHHFTLYPMRCYTFGRFIFCCTCRRLLNANSRTLSGSLPYGVRTFLCYFRKSDHPTLFITRLKKYKQKMFNKQI